MIKSAHKLKVEQEMIACSIISSSDTSKPPQFVYLHGAGTGVKEGVDALSDPIFANGLNILALDFSGHGESSGVLKKGSLKKRVNEACAVIDEFATKQPLVVCGASMGGFIAIKLLGEYEIETLILLCPALYASQAYEVPFDEGFTEIIRSPDSWKMTGVLGLLESFAGNLLLIMGENDEVIPAGVIELIMQHTPNTKRKELYLIPDCPHKIVPWILSQEEELVKLYAKLDEYL